MSECGIESVLRGVLALLLSSLVRFAFLILLLILLLICFFPSFFQYILFFIESIFEREFVEKCNFVNPSVLSLLFLLSFCVSDCL